MKKYLMVLIGLVCSLSHSPLAVAVTSDWNGGAGTPDFNTAGNWSAGVPGPGDTASFNVLGSTAISFSVPSTTLGGFTFISSASAYRLTVSNLQNLQLGSVDNSSGNTQTLINNGGGLTFFGGTINGGGTTVIINSGNLTFQAGTAGNATIINSGVLSFSHGCFLGPCVEATAGDATITNNAGATLQLHDASTLGNATVINQGSVDATQLTISTWSAGSISGSGNFQLGTTTLTVGSNDLSTTVTGNISGAGGSLTKVGNGTLTLAGSNTYTGATTVNAGTLNLLSALPGNVIVGAAGNLSGTGTLGGLVNQATVTPGVNDSGTLTASVYSGTGTLNASFNGASHGALKITGNANLTGGTLNLTGPNFGVGRYSVLNAGSLTGTFATFSSPASSLLTFAPAYTATDAFVLIDFATPFLPFAQNTNQRSVAANLNGPKNTSTAEFTNAINDIAQLPASQIPDALSQISGDSLASYQEVGLQNAALFTQGMRGRAAMRRASPDDWRAVNVSSGSCGLWAQGVGWVDTMKADSSLGSPASRATAGGFQAGYDGLATDNLLIGYSGGYTQTNLDVTDRASAGNAKSIQSGVYVGYTREAWFTNGAMAYIAGSNDNSRTIRYSGINEQSSANFNSRAYTTFLETGYSFHQRDAWTLEPALSLRQTHLSQDGFTESGAPGLDLTVADRSLNSVVSSLGVGLKRLFFQDASHPLALNASVAWEHELANTHDALSAHFAETSGGSDFTVEGTPRSRDAAAIGLEGHVPVRTNLEVFGSYTATVASVQTIQKLFGGARLKW